MTIKRIILCNPLEIPERDTGAIIRRMVAIRQSRPTYTATRSTTFHCYRTRLPLDKMLFPAQHCRFSTSPRLLILPEHSILLMLYGDRSAKSSRGIRLTHRSGYADQTAIFFLTVENGHHLRFRGWRRAYQ